MREIYISLKLKPVTMQHVQKKILPPSHLPAIIRITHNKKFIHSSTTFKGDGWLLLCVYWNQRKASRLILEPLTVSQLFPPFIPCESSSPFTSASYLSLSSARVSQSVQWHPLFFQINLNIILTSPRSPNTQVCTYDITNENPRHIIWYGQPKHSIIPKHKSKIPK